MTKEFEKTLRHDDFTYKSDLCTTIPWMETLVASLEHLEASKIRLRVQKYIYYIKSLIYLLL